MAPAVELTSVLSSALEKAEYSASRGGASYTYEQPTTSPFYRHVISPICDWIVANCVPQFVSPNTLTIAGLLSAAVAPLFLRSHQPLAACALWACYGLFDNMDGKQARRTKQSSVRGEFLDHMADSAASTLLVYIVTYGFIKKFPETHWSAFLGCQVPFLLGCWYYRCKGTVLLGSASTGVQFTVDEVNFILVPFLLLAQYFGLLPSAYGRAFMYLVASGCAVEGFCVLKEIWAGEGPSASLQLKIAGASLTYFLTIVLATGYSAPIAALPTFAWLCSTLIFPPCAAKAGVQPTFLQMDPVCPAVAGTIVTACYLSGWPEVYYAAQFLCSCILAYVVSGQLRSIPGSS